MSRQIPLIALVLCLCGLGWLLPAAQADASAHRSPAAPLGGVNVLGLFNGASLSNADSEIAVARKLHARVVRAEVPWSTLEPTGPGAIQPRAVAFLDRLIGDAASAGIRVIVFVDSTPCWDSSAPAPLLASCSPYEYSQANSWPPRDPADYGAVCAFLAQRYGTRLAAIEIWNEPDQSNEDYFAGTNKVQLYAELLRAAYPAIKQANPQVPVLAGSLVGANGAFLRDLYADGIKGYYNGLAVHFYTLTLRGVRAIHEVQLANGDTTPVWLTEFGWSSCYPAQQVQEEQTCVTTQTQASNITNTFRSLARAPYVAADVLYDLQNSGTEKFGVLTASGARKPAFNALAQVLASPFGNPSPVTLSLRRRGSQVLAAGSGPVGDVMQLEAFRGRVLRYKAVFTLDRFNRYALLLPQVLGTSGLRVRVYQYWAGLGKAAQRTI